MNSPRHPVAYAILVKSAGKFRIRFLKAVLDAEGFLVPSRDFVEVGGTATLFKSGPVAEPEWIASAPVQHLISVDEANGATWSVPSQLA